MLLLIYLRKAGILLIEKPTYKVRFMRSKKCLNLNKKTAIIKRMAMLDNNEMFDDFSEPDKDNVEATLSVHGTNVKVEKNTVVIFNHKNKTGQEFKREADLIIEYLISEGYVNKKKFKVKIITTSK
jgi:hypothetical protein